MKKRGKEDEKESFSLFFLLPAMTKVAAAVADRS